MPGFTSAAMQYRLLLHQLQPMPQRLLITTAVSAAKSAARMSMLVALASWSELTGCIHMSLACSLHAVYGTTENTFWNVLFIAHSLCWNATLHG